MADSRELDAAERYAKGTPLNWAVIGAGIERGFRARRRRRRRQVGAAAMAAAVGIGSVFWFLPDPAQERVAKPVVTTFSDATARALVDRCSAELSGSEATESTYVISPDRGMAVALVRDEDAAWMCASADPTLADLDPDELALPEREGRRSQTVEWTSVRLGGGTYVGGVVAEDVSGPWVGGSDFVVRNRHKRLANDGSLNVVLVQRGPLAPEEYLVFGLSDKQGCECGAELQVTDEMFDG